MYCICGCGKITSRAIKNRKERGWIKGKYMRFFPGHHNRKPGILYKVNKKTKCWEWRRYIMKNGYGTITRGRIYLAHRYFYIQKFGSIPEGLELDHKCRNRRCVNPDHLEPVTRLINSHRGAKSKVNLKIVREIRNLKGRWTQKMISKKYKIGRTLVYGILENKVWI